MKTKLLDQQNHFKSSQIIYQWGYFDGLKIKLLNLEFFMVYQTLNCFIFAHFLNFDIELALLVGNFGSYCYWNYWYHKLHLPMMILLNILKWSSHNLCFESCYLVLQLISKNLKVLILDYYSACDGIDFLGLVCPR